MDQDAAPQAHLKHIKLMGFKSIKELDLEMRSINVLIGANGSGKSNFISIFSLLRSIAQGKFRSYIAENGGASNFLHFGPKNTPKIIMDIDVSQNGYHSELVYDPFEDNLIFKKEYCKFAGIGRNIYEMMGKNGESGLFAGDVASPAVRQYTRTYLQGCQVYHFHDTGKTAGFKQSSPLDATDYLYPDAKNIAAFLYMLRERWNDSYKEIVDAIRVVAPFFHDFYLEPRGEQSILLKWIHKKHDEPFSAQQLSDGTARFICMATLFLQPLHLRPNTIILDEPELGLHPAALETLADIIKSVSKNRQIICSTQSVTFANHFAPEDFIIVDQSDGVSTFSRPNPETLKIWLEEYKMGDLWSKNLIGGRPEW